MRVKPRQYPEWARPRAVLLQAALAVVVLAAAYYAFANMSANLSGKSIASGFGFLGEKSGFAINQTLIAYSEQSTYGRVFWVGLLNTLLVAILGIAIATMLGFLLGLARLSANWMVNALASAYVEIMRNIPLLLHLFFWYFAVLRTLPEPQQAYQLWHGVYLNNRGLYLPSPGVEISETALWMALFAGTAVTATVLARRRNSIGSVLGALLFGVAATVFVCLGAYVLGALDFSLDLPALQGFNFQGGFKLLPELTALVLALSLYTAGYIAEIVRAGLLAVPRGQVEAALGLGLSRSQALRLVIVPQAMRVIIPPLTSQYLNILKNSSLAVAIAYPDLVSVFAGTALNQTGQALEILTITLGVYLTLSLIMAAIMNWFNASAVRHGNLADV